MICCGSLLCIGWSLYWYLVVYSVVLCYIGWWSVDGWWLVYLVYWYCCLWWWLISSCLWVGNNCFFSFVVYRFLLRSYGLGWWWSWLLGWVGWFFLIVCLDWIGVLGWWYWFGWCCWWWIGFYFSLLFDCWCGCGCVFCLGWRICWFIGLVGVFWNVIYWWCYLIVYGWWYLFCWCCWCCEWLSNYVVSLCGLGILCFLVCWVKVYGCFWDRWWSGCFGCSLGCFGCWVMIVYWYSYLVYLDWRWMLYCCCCCWWLGCRIVCWCVYWCLVRLWNWSCWRLFYFWRWWFGLYCCIVW